MDRFKGLGVAMVTPFNADGTVDMESLDKLTDHLVANGADYLVVMGTTGENPTIDANEQKRILERIQQVNEGRKPIVFGVGGNNTGAVTQRLKSLSYTGIDGILSVSPYYNKPNQQGILTHFRQVADSAGVPVIIYNVPSRTGSTISAETTLALAEHPNIIATKEASGNFDLCMEIIRSKPNDFIVISGDDLYTLPFMSMGMEGVISVIGNAFTKTFSQMVHYAIDGNFENARYLHYKLAPFMNAIFADGSPGGIKAVLEELGICKAHVRPPLADINQDLRKQIKEMVQGFERPM